MVEWRRAYAVAASGKFAALTASLNGYFHESLFQAVPSERASNGAAGNLSLTCSAKNAAVDAGRLILRSCPDLSLPTVSTPRRLSKLPAVSSAIAPGRSGTND